MCGGTVARTTTTEYFGFELRRAREAAGLSREDFGRLVNYAPSTIGAFETGERFPNPRLAKAADEHLGTSDRFTEMYSRLLTGELYEEGFRPWAGIEREATSLWIYELALMPGLLQTEGYARAQMNDDAKVASRLARQEILTRDDPPPPSLVVLVYEQVLRTIVGDEEVMRKQLEHLTEAAQQHVIQVIPYNARTYLHLDGPFTVASVEGHDLCFVETPVHGVVADGAEVVSRLKRRWDVIRAQALSVPQSTELIQEVMKQWT
jgi:transcriptional regulator with XRE-family HTH domain